MKIFMITIALLAGLDLAHEAINKYADSDGKIRKFWDRTFGRLHKFLEHDILENAIKVYEKAGMLIGKIFAKKGTQQ